MGPGKDCKPYETAAGLSNMPANTTETIQKSQSDQLEGENKINKSLIRFLKNKLVIASQIWNVSEAL